MFSVFGLSTITRCFSTLQGPLYFRSTPCLFAEPLKKKKKLDPQIIKNREERKKKRIEKQIRKLEKSSRQYKPIEECEIPLDIVNKGNLRQRNLSHLSEEVQSYRIDTLKQWAIYKMGRKLSDIKMVDRIILSQQWALDQLKNESKELYTAAIQLDEDLLPFKSIGPVETPPIENYDSPDGEYIDISKKWDN